MTDTVELGGKIVLTGFAGVDGGSMIILKKIIGNYAKHFSETVPGFESLVLILQPQVAARWIVDAKVVGEKSAHAHTDEKNLFVAIDKALKHLERSLS